MGLVLYGSEMTVNLLKDVVLPPRSGDSWLVKQGQYIRVIEVEGGQIGDFVCFNAHNLKDRFSQARTKANQRKFLISTGDHLYTRANNILLTIAEDTYGIHDLQYGMCNLWAFQKRGWRRPMGEEAGPDDERSRIGGALGPPPFGCYEILQEVLRPWSIAPEDIPDPLNIFQTVHFDVNKGTLWIEEGRSKPGDYIDLAAEMDTLCALSACPSVGRPLRVQIYEP